jgi:hypothetical protein
MSLRRRDLERVPTVKFVYPEGLRLNSSFQITYGLQSAPDTMQGSLPVDTLFIWDDLRLNSSSQRG